MHFMLLHDENSISTVLDCCHAIKASINFQTTVFMSVKNVENILCDRC